MLSRRRGASFAIGLDLTMLSAWVIFGLYGIRIGRVGIFPVALAHLILMPLAGSFFSHGKTEAARWSYALLTGPRCGLFAAAVVTGEAPAALAGTIAGLALWVFVGVRPRTRHVVLFAATVVAGGFLYGTLPEPPFWVG